MAKPVDRDEQHLLLIDDDESFALVLRRSLERRGFNVALAHTGEQALDAAKASLFSHALLDLKLGDESGLQLIEPLLHTNPEMKIVVLTGYGSISTAVRAVKAGAHNYLAKPVGLAAVMAAFEEAVPKSDEQEESARMSLGRLEWEHIQRVLEEHDGNISATARSLKMHRRTLQRKLQKRPDKL